MRETVGEMGKLRSTTGATGKTTAQIKRRAQTGMEMEMGMGMKTYTLFCCPIPMVMVMVMVDMPVLLQIESW